MQDKMLKSNFKIFFSFTESFKKVFVLVLPVNYVTIIFVTNNIQ